MPDPTEASNSSAGATVWPPPPSSAPETFTVEGVTVTRAVGHLLVNNPAVAWSSIRSWLSFMLFQVGLFFMGSLFLVVIYFRDVQPNFPPFWRDPVFTITMQSWFGIVAGNSVVVTLIPGLAYILSGRGTVAFQKEGQEACSGIRLFGGTGRVEAVTVRPGHFLFRGRYHVNYRVARPGQYLSSRYRGQWIGSFRKAEDAERVAQEIGQCVNVSVQDLSARTKG